jgi:hypothetical protein
MNSKSSKLWDRRWKRDLFFGFTLIGCFFIYRYEWMLSFPPSGPHTWRQADCVSITDNYYSHGMRFFWPEIHYQISDGDSSGYTAGEFPGLYYFNAALWKIFGKHLGISRFVSILLTFLGLFALYRSYMLWTGNYFWSVVCPLFLLSTPAIAEYGSNFLTDVPAFSLALVGWYFFSRFYHENNDRPLVYMAMFFMFAGLLKVSALIFFVVISSIWMLERVGLRLGPEGRRAFERPFRQLALLIVCVLGIVAWYQFASQFNYLHNGKYTFNSPWPIWNLSAEEIIRLAREFWNWTSVFTMPVLYWYIVPSLLLGWIFLLHRCKPFVRWVCGMTLLGVVSYFALWYQAIDQHDYYFANAFVLLIVLPLPYLSSGVRLKPVLSKIIKGIAVVLLLYGVIYTRQNLELRHFPQERFSYPLMPEQPVGLMKWFHWERTSRTKGLDKMGPLLDSVGCGPESKVVIMPDPTINHTLILVDRKGWTSFGGREPREVVMSSMQKGAEFLIVTHPDIYLRTDMASLRDFKVVSFGCADIIDLRKFRTAGTP